MNENRGRGRLIAKAGFQNFHSARLARLGRDIFGDLRSTPAVPMPKITAFVARSFDPRDEQKIEPILRFLNSFRAAGFLAESAEQAEVESVSQKVRRMIDASDVFVGIFTRRHPVYDPKSLWRAAIPLVRNRLVAERWVAPPWVIRSEERRVG